MKEIILFERSVLVLFLLGVRTPEFMLFFDELYAQTIKFIRVKMVIIILIGNIPDHEKISSIMCPT